MNTPDWTIRLHERASNAIDDADGSVRERIQSGLDELKRSPEQRTKPLSGSLRGARSYRFGTPSGEYRILLVLDHSSQIVKVYYVGSRENFYRTIRRLFS